ncbi:MAG: IS110 family transposase [Candidatus Nitrosocosmicus sp.]|nr:IS110 family transposase [Candidatus Nitrosocosmicus sp.]
MKKIETGIKTNQQQHCKDCVGNISSSYDNRDTDARYYVSIDIGKKNCVACITDKDGLIVEETRYSNTLSEACDFAQHIDQQYDGTNCTAVVESTANMWIKTYKALEQAGIQTKLANPFKTRVIAEARIKTDKLDARILCHLLRSNLIPESYVAPDSIREDRSILRLRINLVQDRTRIANRVHSLLDKYDMDQPCSHLVGKKGLNWLKSLKLDGNDQFQLNNHINNIEFLNNEIIQIDKKVSSQAVKNKDVKILMSITGIDYFSAMLIMSEIEDITRFNDPSKLVSWSGLCPTVHQSGNSLYMGRMKDGNKKIRWIMIQAANTAIRTDGRMKKYYAKIVKRHGHSIAITHVANKMIRIMWHMLKNNENYKDGKPETYLRKLKRINR